VPRPMVLALKGRASGCREGVRRAAIPLLLALVLGAVPGAAAGASQVVIEDTASSFEPRSTTLSVGGSVRWSNDDDEAHTTTATGALALWNIPLPVGGEATRAFAQAGTFPYFCIPHPSMVGSVRVGMKASGPSARRGQRVVLRMASAGAASGFRYRVQRRAPGGAWQTWKTTTSRTTSWVPKSKGVWRFRARTERVSNGAASGWSPPLSISVGS
jgi:plastocyanin